jgi:hypothetical protein
VSLKSIILSCFVPKRLFWVFALGVCASVIAYIFFVQATVSMVVSERLLAKQAQVIYSEIASLEIEYTALRNSMTPLQANELGFYEIVERTYANKARLVQR